MIVVNVDKPTTTITIHKEGCSFLNRSKKPQDGFHKEFQNEEEAMKYIKENYPTYKVNRCSKCFKK